MNHVLKNIKQKLHDLYCILFIWLSEKSWLISATENTSSLLKALESLVSMLLPCHLTADSSSFIQKENLGDLAWFWRFYKLNIVYQTVHVCHILLFYFCKAENACEKFTITMLYKKISANNCSRCPVRWLWSQRCSSVMETLRGWFPLNKDRTKPTKHDTRDFRNIEHLLFKSSRPPEESGIHKPARCFGSSWTQKHSFDAAYEHLHY